MLHREFAGTGWNALIPSLLRSGRATEVARCAAGFDTLRAASDRLSPQPFLEGVDVPDWAQRLPPQLQASVATYCANFSDARKQIERLLENQLPAPDRVTQEIQVLVRLSCENPSKERIQRRLRNLRGRLENPKPLTQATLSRLQHKIDGALTYRVFHDFHLNVESKLVNLVADCPLPRQVIKEILSPRHQELICAIFGVREPFRSFGLRLLRKRWGGAAWDLNAEPANRRFVESMAALDVQMEPWLARGPLKIVPGGAAGSVTLAFERDEVEQLLMGYYFSTCLGTDGCNFFSAIANTVDINKQVLYARDSRGRVLGRSLIAIGESGSLLTFCPYCHDAAFPFADHVAEIAAELAARMNTFVSQWDHVKSLVAPEWYDDGAYDLGRAIASVDSPVRKAIASASQETLLAALDSALQPVGLTDTALALVIDLPEMQACPDCIVPLIPRLKNIQAQLSTRTQMVAAWLAHRANQHGYAAQVARKLGPDWIAREIRSNRYLTPWAWSALEMLLTYDPSAALRVIRQTRPRRVRRDEDETDEDRLQLLTRCLERLGRPKSAEEVRRKILK